MSAEKVADAASAAGPEPAPSTAPGYGARWLKPAVLAALFVASLLTSWATRGHVPAESSSNHSDEQRRPHASKPPIPDADVFRLRDKQDLVAGDSALRDGNWELALSIYQAIAGETKQALPSRLLLRLGLCHEELGQWTQAVRALQTVAAQGTPSESITAQIALARLDIRRHNTDAALTLLWPVVLEAQRHSKESPILDDAQALLALALAQSVLPLGAKNVLEPQTLPPYGLGWAVERQLSWLNVAVAMRDRNGQDKIALTSAPPTDSPVLKSVVISMAPVTATIDKIASTTGMTVAWSPAAKQQVEDRTVTLNIANRPAADVIRDVAACFHLACVVEKNQVRLQSMDELTKDACAQQQLQLAKRVVKTVVDEHPRHVLTPALYLALGYLNSREDPSEALTWQQRLIEEAPHSKLAAEAQFQSGALLRRTGKYPEAQRAFFRVIDQAPAHPLAAVAMIHLGQMHLEQGEWKKAQTLLRRGVATHGVVSVRPSAILTLAAATIVSDEPQATLPIIAKARDAWPDENHRLTAAFLAAYARYRHGAKRKQRMRDGDELLITLLNAPEDSILGAYGRHLRSMAFGELGMWHEAARSYENALTHCHGPFADEMTYRLAEVYLRLQMHDESSKRFTALAAGAGPWSHLAEFELARLDLQQNRAGNCVQRCQQLLQVPTALRPAEILTLMGRAFEREGNYQQAARCYAGQFPD